MVGRHSGGDLFTSSYKGEGWRGREGKGGGRRKRGREVIRDVECEEEEQRGTHRVSVFTLFPPEM